MELARPADGRPARHPLRDAEHLCGQNAQIAQTTCSKASRKSSGPPKLPSDPPAPEPRRIEPPQPLPGRQPSPMSVTFYVSATDGDDDSTGRSPKRNCPVKQCGGGDGPFATFQRAQRAVRELDKRNLRSVIVQFEEGTYFLAAESRGQPPESRSIALNAADFGSADTEIIYESFPGAKPVISGGLRVRDWKLSEDNRWIATLPEDIVDFENLYVGDERRLRPRLVLPDGEGDRYLGSYLRIEDAVYVDTEVKDRCPKPAQADGPHKGKFLCLDRFVYNVSDPISSLLAQPYARSDGRGLQEFFERWHCSYRRYRARRLRAVCGGQAPHCMYRPQ